MRHGQSSFQDFQVDGSLHFQRCSFTVHPGSKQFSRGNSGEMHTEVLTAFKVHMTTKASTIRPSQRPRFYRLIVVACNASGMREVSVDTRKECNRPPTKCSLAHNFTRSARTICRLVADNPELLGCKRFRMGAGEAVVSPRAPGFGQALRVVETVGFPVGPAYTSLHVSTIRKYQSDPEGFCTRVQHACSGPLSLKIWNLQPRIGTWKKERHSAHGGGAASNPYQSCSFCSHSFDAVEAQTGSSWLRPLAEQIEMHGHSAESRIPGQPLKGQDGEEIDV
jgi:hypothetical protein